MGLYRNGGAEDCSSAPGCNEAYVDRVRKIGEKWSRLGHENVAVKRNILSKKYSANRGTRPNGLFFKYQGLRITEHQRMRGSAQLATTCSSAVCPY